MKIAIFTDTYLPQLNGVAIYLSESIKELSKNQDVILFAPGDGPLKIENHKNLRIYWIPSSPFPFYEGYKVASMDYKKVSNILKKEMPDVVHAHAPINLGLQGLIAAKRKKIPTVVTYHTHFPDYVPHLLSGKLPKMFEHLSKMAVKKMIKYVFREVNVVTAPTRELVSELESYGLRNVVYLPNGVDFAKLKTSPESIEKFKKQNKIPDGKIVLYLGRISFEKRLDDLLKAFKTIEKKGLFLVLVGGGPYLKKFKELAKYLNIKNVIFTGFIKSENIGSAYGCGDVFVSASDSETFGLTFVEAMYSGLPAIGVDKFGPKEIIQTGKNGLIVPAGDVLSLAKAMERLIKDKKMRGEMSKAAKKRADEYSIKNSVRKTLDIYEEITPSS